METKERAYQNCTLAQSVVSQLHRKKGKDGVNKPSQTSRLRSDDGMYIKFCQNYDVDTKRSDETNTKLSPDSKLYVEVMEQRDKEGLGNVRVYRTVCIFLSLTCLFLLLLILILGVKYIAVGCPERVPEEAVTQVCSLQTCKALFPQFQKQKSGCQLCAEDWVDFEGSCFYFSLEKQKWEGAKKSCVDKGGDLAVIPNQKVQNFLSTKGYLMYWIGLRNQANGWTWVNNITLGESYWVENARNGDCGILRGGDPPGKSWMKAECRVKTYYICQSQP